MDKAQKEYYLREQLKAIRKELGDGPDADEELEDINKAIEKAGLPPTCAKKPTSSSSGSPRCTATRRKPASYAPISTGWRNCRGKDVQGSA